MTLSSDDWQVSAVGTNTVGQTVDFTFPINATSDLIVESRVTATGVVTSLTETTNYTVSIDGDDGGTITMVTAVATADDLVAHRVTPKTQTLDLTQGGLFNAENVEDALDKLTKIVVELKERVDRSIFAPQSDPTTIEMELPSTIDRASKYVLFDSDGHVTAGDIVDASAITVSALGETLVARATNALMRSDLGVVIGTDVQAYDGDLADLAALTPTNNNFIVGDGTDWAKETPANALTSLGVTAFMKTLLDDTTSTIARATLEIDDLADIVCNNDSVVCNGNTVVTN